ncbi:MULTISPECIES: MFS transporter [unclassified Azospirillum]|uniref:MFS transporter n=1 Tax=unclassified Azospirillum TaxID=2630922 RepID=UPI000B6A3041|nr:MULTISPECIES: MFS transporter [unclassified Azospirillum]SNS15410.1 Nitrate/nitrite transporter NarK [Azospirillum sp. RU38E]SNS32665.1 Nitrate/nitrite transporter NarK [Azospirillum sp. RU37A]
MTEQSEFKQGWKVVATAAMGIGTGLSPIPFYTVGVFVAPLMAAFGWAVDQIMVCLMIQTFGSTVMAPIIGVLADRYGVRRVTLVSVVLFGLSLALFALGNGSLTLFYLNWLLLATVGAGTLPITWTRPVNNWFNKHRGLALGLSLLGTGLFGTMAKLYANFLIGEVGWRLAYVGLGLLPLLLAFPLALAWFRDREDVPTARHATAPAVLEGVSFAAALRTRHFWVLALAFLPIAFAVGGPIPNLERILGSKGISTAEAVSIASLLGPAVIVGRLSGGWLIDRFWAPGVAFVLLSVPALACWAMTGDTINSHMAMLAVAMIGFAAGVEYDVMAFLVSRYFGMRAYGSIYGAIYAFFAVGAGFGPYIFGRIYVLNGSYDTGLLLGAVGFVLGAVLLLGLGRYPDLSRSRKLTENQLAMA